MCEPTLQSSAPILAAASGARMKCSRSWWSASASTTPRWLRLHLPSWRLPLPHNLLQAAEALSWLLRHCLPSGLFRGSIGGSTAVCPSPRLKRLKELSRPVSAALPIRKPSFYTTPPVRDASLCGSPTPSGDFSTFPKTHDGDSPVGCAKSINGEAAGSACQFTLDRTAVLEIPSRSWKIVNVNITGNAFSDDSEG